MDEAFARYRMKNSTAEAKILRAPREWFVRYGLELTDAAVGDWVKDNAAAADAAWTTAKDTFKAGCLLVEDVTAVGSGEAGTDKTKLKAQIDAAKAELDAGVTFDVVARRYNAAEDAFPSFGVHCLAEDAPQTLKDAAAKLDAGKVSGVVELENGFAILKGHGKLAAEDVEKVGRDAENHRVAARFLADKRVADFVAEVEQELTKGTGVEEALKLCVERFQVKLKSTSTASAAMASAATVAEVRPKVDASGAFTLYDAPIPDVVGGESATVKAFSLNVGERARFTQRSGMALLILTAKKEVTREDFAKDGQSFTDELRRDRQREAVTRYVLALRKKSEKKIHIVPSLLEEPKQSHE